MKKYSVVTILFLLFTQYGFTQSNYYHPLDWLPQQQEMAALQGEVHAIEAKTYLPNEKEEIGELLQLNYYEWDTSDRIYRWEYEDYNLGIQFIQMYTYFDIDDNRLDTREHYNEHGNLVEATVYDYDLVHEDMVKKIYVTEYDGMSPEEEVTRELMIDVVLDEDGVRRKDVTYKADGTIQAEVEIKYNEIGLVSSKNRFNSSGEWIWTDSIEYTPLYRKSRTLTIRPDRLNGGKKETATDYVYDEQMQLIAMKVGDTEYQFQYEYDDQNNWVVKKIFKLFDGALDLQSIVMREIRYKED